MYRRFGFETAGVRKNYYAETNEDALVMWAYDIDSDRLREPRLAGIEAGIRGTTVDETLAAAPLGEDPRHRDVVRRDGGGGGRGRPDRQELGGVAARSTCTPASAASCPRWPAGPTSSCSRRWSPRPWTIADATPGDLDAVAATIGPGLIGSLLVGVSAAKAYALAWGVPVRRRQPPGGPPARRLPRGPGPGPAGGGAAGVGRPHPAHP